MTIVWLKAVDLCGKGEAFAFIRDGHISHTGRLPVKSLGANPGSGRLHSVNRLKAGMLQVSRSTG